MNYNFDIDLAVKIGVDESIMLNNFVYWLLKNKANNKNLFDGNFWTYNSVRAYCELFPFWKESQIKRILKSLVEQNILIVGNYNQNAYDRTNWYALSSEYIYLIDWTISTNGKEENSQPIPNKNTDTINYDEYLTLWNEFAIKNKKSKIVKLTNVRKKQIASRLKDYKNFLEIFKYILVKAEKTNFLLQGNFFDFDWITKNDNNIAKILEGKYDNGKSQEVVI